jgi:hypothetical protein
MRHSHRSTHVLVLVIAAIGACAPDGSDTPLLIVQNQDSGSGGDCTLDSAPTELFIGAGIIDTLSASGYIMTPVIENFSTVPDQVDKTQRFFFLEGAEISIDIGNDSDGLPVLTEEERAGLPADLLAFVVNFTGLVEPENGTTALHIVVVPKEVLDLIAAKTPVPVEITVNLRVFGTMAGSDASTQVFSYPITVCTDCIKVDVGPCTALADDFEAHEGGGCNLLQDKQLDCCTSSLGAEVCPAVAESVK